MIRKCLVLLVCALMLGSARWSGADKLEQDFRELPMAARRLTGPLFWLHGNESKERLLQMLDKVVASGNGTFTPESRPHSDWLGEGWYRDLGICLDAAKKNDLTMWIFDEKWWPSGGVDGKVPVEFSSKVMKADEMAVQGPSNFDMDGYASNLIAVIAGKDTADGIDPSSLIDLTSSVKDGKLTWNAPAGNWKVMKFTWQNNPGLVDGASKDCVDWYIKTVYQPHYDHFKADFGKTIKGFFYDEPETRGDWGTGVLPMLAERGVDWKKALVAYKFKLAGDEQTSAKYQYLDAFAETWGRTLYGGLSKWCEERNVISMGHFLEHNWEYLDNGKCAGNMFQLQKYSGMGGIDLVCQQMYPGQRPMGVYQTPKLGSSITHAYGMKDDITMSEMFGAYGQSITYPQMKWLTDQMQVRGVNYMVPHSFNPRAPYDDDCPPFFYNGGFEPRYPLYRVYADYTSRLSLMLSGGKHVCPIALLYLGNSAHVGKYIPPEEMTTTIQDALYDCDWLPYDVMEKDVQIKGHELALRDERYQALIVPPVEVIPYKTLERVQAFFESGGVVIGYGYLPTKPATIGKSSSDIAQLCSAIWGDAKPGLGLCKKSQKGGRSYLLPKNISPEDLQKVLEEGAGIYPALRALKGETNHWLHVLHRVKDSKEIFLVCNQNHDGPARTFTFQINAPGYPEIWDAMRNEITSVPYLQYSGLSQIDITLQPNESVLIVMQPERRKLPRRIDEQTKPLAVYKVKGRVQPVVVGTPSLGEMPALDGCVWVWSPEADMASPPAGKRYFRSVLNIPSGRNVKSAEFLLTCDNEFTLFINGKEAGKTQGLDVWRRPAKLDIAKLLIAGKNLFALEARNLENQPNPAGLIGICKIELDNGQKIDFLINSSWKASAEAVNGWQAPNYDDSKWAKAVEIGKFGVAPWGMMDASSKLTLSPVQDTTFKGSCVIPSVIDPAKTRIYIEADKIGPEAAASITINGKYAGGFIDKPFRLDVTKFLKKGANSIIVAPFNPEGLRLAVYSK